MSADVGSHARALHATRAKVHIIYMAMTDVGSGLRLCAACVADDECFGIAITYDTWQHIVVALEYDIYCLGGQRSVTLIIFMTKSANADRYLPRDTGRKRGTSRRRVSVCRSVRHIRLLYGTRLMIASYFF